MNEDGYWISVWTAVAAGIVGVVASIAISATVYSYTVTDRVVACVESGGEWLTDVGCTR